MTSIWLYVGGAVLAIILLAAFWRKIVRAILLLTVLGVGGLIAWAFAQQASATKQVATAATAAARGSAAGNVALLLVVGLFVIGALVAGYVALRRYLARRDEAEWYDYTPQFQLPTAYPSVPDQSVASVNALVQLELLRALRDLRAPQTTALVALPDDGDDDDGVPVWW